MIRYGLLRGLQGLLVIWGIVSLLFLIFYGVGDPTDFIVGDQADAATVASIRAKYGLDQPLGRQYLNYLHQLSPWGLVPSQQPDPVAHWTWWETPAGSWGVKMPDLGRSFHSRQPVALLIGQRLEGTFILAMAAISFAALLGILLGLLSAVNRDNWLDRSILSFSVLGISAPSYFVGVFLAWLLAVRFKSLTGLPVNGYIFEPNIFDEGRHFVGRNLILPALALGIRPLAVFIQLTRSAMLDVLHSEYVRTAHSKGLGKWTVWIRHALRNALNPVVTAITGWLASLLAGAFFIEYIFNWRGIGKLTIDALNTQDFPVIIGCAMFIGTLFVLINILTDLIYSWLDPRVTLIS